MNQIIIINCTQKALIDFIQIAYREKYEILKTIVKEETNLVHVHIKTNKRMIWEYEDTSGNMYINMSTNIKIELPK